MTTQLVTLQVDETLSIAEQVMALARIRHLPVVDAEGRLVGLVSHRDLLSAATSTASPVSPEVARAFKRTIEAGKIMSRDVLTADPDTLVVDAAKRMRAHKIGCLPVLEDGLLVGLVTEADFLDLLIRALEGSSTPPTDHERLQ